MFQEVAKEGNAVKCVTIGDAAVGKTCLLLTYTTDKFPADYMPTVFDNYEAKLTINGEEFKFQLWDTAGSEHFDILRPLSYKEADVYIIVYSVIDRSSFENVEHKWVKDIKTKGDPDVPFIVIGNKIDLRRNNAANNNNADGKPISFSEGEKKSNKMGAAKFYEVSAYTQENLKSTFEGIITVAFNRLQWIKQKKLMGGKTKNDRKKAEHMECKCTII